MKEPFRSRSICLGGAGTERNGTEGGTAFLPCLFIYSFLFVGPLWMGTVQVQSLIGHISDDKKFQIPRRQKNVSALVV